MTVPRSVLEVNACLWSRRLGGDVPDSQVAQWRSLGVDAVWLMGVWRRSAEGRRIALVHPGLCQEYTRALPDWREEDVAGSPYAICGYEVSAELGGAEGLASLRAKLSDHGLSLILDFVSNHTARDHPWVTEHPAWYVCGTESDLAREPGNWFVASTGDGPRVLAHGRDPFFPGWTDTAQLDYAGAELQAQMCSELERLTTMCDGVRCDMAMLVLSTVFEKTWGRKCTEFWPEAIRRARAVRPDFCFIAEAYWGLDGTLREMGFDLTYDKELLDRVVSGQALRREQFDRPPSEHRQRLRFLENHDEPRIASRLDRDRHQAAAVWVFSLPSSRLFLDGQLEGMRTRLPVQLLREPCQAPDETLRSCYRALLVALGRDAVRHGSWQLLVPTPAWTGNESHVCILGQGYDDEREHVRVFVNWSEHRSQCWIPLSLGPLTGKQVVLRDLLGPKVFVRDGLELTVRGLYLDLEPWETHFLECVVQAAGEGSA